MITSCSILLLTTLATPAETHRVEPPDRMALILLTPGQRDVEALLINELSETIESSTPLRFERRPAVLLIDCDQSLACLANNLHREEKQIRRAIIVSLTEVKEGLLLSAMLLDVDRAVAAVAAA